MIDLHTHILPGLDDGSRTVEDARALARRAAAEGVTAVAATPHVRSDYPTRPEEMEGGVARLREDFLEQGIEVEVLHGAEVALDALDALDRDALERLTLAQSGRYLLVEFPYAGWPAGLEQAAHGLREQGLTPVLAHPERNREVQSDPGRLEAVVAEGALVQITAASLDGRVGRTARRATERLLALRLVHVLATDAHTPEIREAGLAAAVEALEDDVLARYLTAEAPAAIVGGEPVPAPPRFRRRRRFLAF